MTKTKEEDASEIELVRLGANSFFGERALLQDEPRAANVKASEKGEVKAVVLSRSIFKEIMSEVSTHLAGSEKGDFFSPFEARISVRFHLFRLILDERSSLVEFSKSGPFP